MFEKILIKRLLRHGNSPQRCATILDKFLKSNHERKYLIIEGADFSEAQETKNTIKFIGYTGKKLEANIVYYVIARAEYPNKIVKAVLRKTYANGNVIMEKVV